MDISRLKKQIEQITHKRFYCSRGKHRTNMPDGSLANFCGRCGHQLNQSISVETTIKWNVHSAIGWFNVVLGMIALTPAAFGHSDYFIWGGVFGLTSGALMVTMSGPLKTIERRIT